MAMRGRLTMDLDRRAFLGLAAAGVTGCVRDPLPLVGRSEVVVTHQPLGFAIICR